MKYRVTVWYQDGTFTGRVFGTYQLAMAWLETAVKDAKTFHRASIVAL